MQGGANNRVLTAMLGVAIGGLVAVGMGGGGIPALLSGLVGGLGATAIASPQPISMTTKSRLLPAAPPSLPVAAAPPPPSPPVEGRPDRPEPSPLFSDEKVASYLGSIQAYSPLSTYERPSPYYPEENPLAAAISVDYQVGIPTPPPGQVPSRDQEFEELFND